MRIVGLSSALHKARAMQATWALKLFNFFADWSNCASIHSCSYKFAFLTNRDQSPSDAIRHSPFAACSLMTYATLLICFISNSPLGPSCLSKISRAVKSLLEPHHGLNPLQLPLDVLLSKLPLLLLVWSNTFVISKGPGRPNILTGSIAPWRFKSYSRESWTLSCITSSVHTSSRISSRFWFCKCGVSLATVALACSAMLVPAGCESNGAVWMGC